MRILMTGATGFVGHTLLSQLIGIGKYQILALTRSDQVLCHDSLRWLVSDLVETSTYLEEIKSFRPEVIIHLAWQDIPDFSFTKSLLNLQNSLEFLSVVMKLDLCQKILVSGSCFELNQQQGECFESGKESSKDHFTWAKNSLRNWLEMETSRRGISLGWMRIFYVYGPMQRKGSLLPTILTEFINQRFPSIKTLHNANDFIFVEDVARGFIRAIEHEFQSGVFHLGSGHSTQIWKLCQIAEELVCGSSTLTEKLLQRNSNPKQSGVNFWANYERSHHLLGWTPQTSLKTGIQKTWEWMKAA